MGIASQGLARQALTELCECLVVDGRELADLERVRTALFD